MSFQTDLILSKCHVISSTALLNIILLILSNSNDHPGFKNAERNINATYTVGLINNKNKNYKFITFFQNIWENSVMASFM